MRRILGSKTALRGANSTPVGVVPRLGCHAPCLIEKHRYLRRLPELEDAEAALLPVTNELRP
jgi:hypothetical protein